MRHLTAMAFVVGLLASGCMHALREPAQDHALQAAEVARRCAESRYEAPCSAELLLDLEALAKQAECIEAIAVAEKCE